MYMDNFPVFQGDLVHDLVYGIGTVEKVMSAENRFVVTFGSRTLSYRQNGSGPFTTRTLFWHNPVMGAPPKSDKAFGFYRELCVTLAKFCAEQAPQINNLVTISENSSGS